MESTELCDIAYKYGTDKCPQLNHAYTPFYYNMFKDVRESVKKVVEFGIGGKRVMRYIPHYKIGAGLRMWRDFFPNAMVYGFDFDERLLFEDDRIQTFLCDETKPDEVRAALNKIGAGDIDLFFDDASHYSLNQKVLCQTVMPLLKKEAIYIIEDVSYSRKLYKALKPVYDVEVPYLEGRRLDLKNSNKLMIVRHK